MTASRTQRLVSSVWSDLETSFKKALEARDHPVRSIFGKPEKTDRDTKPKSVLSPYFDDLCVDHSVTRAQLVGWEAGRDLKKMKLEVEKLATMAQRAEDDHIIGWLHASAGDAMGRSVAAWFGDVRQKHGLASGLISPRTAKNELIRNGWITSAEFPQKQRPSDGPGHVAFTEHSSSPVAVFECQQYAFMLAEDWRLDWDYDPSDGSSLVLVASAKLGLRHPRSRTSPVSGGHR